MGTWEKWEQVDSGPFQGKPEIFVEPAGGYAGGGYVATFSVMDRAGNMINFVPAVPGATGALVNWGGAGVIAHLPPSSGPYGVVVRGLDDGLYTLDFENGKWLKYSGPGRLVSDAVFLGSHAGTQEILGEGSDHQLAYCYISNDERPRLEAKNWQNLGKPGESGGKKGINGRPSIVYGNDGMHVFVRGQDNHLWHILGEYDWQGPQTFGKWTNLGGGLSSVPVAINSGQMNDKIECFVIGEGKALWTITGDGQNWSDFQNLGGQLKGLPAAVNTFTGDSTFVFGRGVHDKLWYRRRNGAAWQRWQSLDGQLTSDPAVMLEPTNYGGARLNCMALGEKGALWQRTYKVTRGEYGSDAPTSDTSTISYTVQDGDWIYRIGRSLDVAVNDIKKANSQIRNFDRIQPGDKLSIPVKKRDGRVFYIIQQDDNLGRISKAFGVTMDSLKRENNIQNADRIYLGATLAIRV